MRWNVKSLGLAVGLEEFAGCNNLIHEVPEVFWDVGGEAYKRISVKAVKDWGTDAGKERGGKERRRGTYYVP